MQTKPTSIPKKLNHINIRLIFSLLVVIAVLLFIGNLIKQISETPYRKTVQTIPGEYLELFKKVEVAQLKNPFTDISAGYPVSNLDYEDKYSIVIWKSKIQKDYTLANIFKESHNSANIEIDTGYLTPSDLNITFVIVPESFK